MPAALLPPGLLGSTENGDTQTFCQGTEEGGKKKKEKKEKKDFVLRYFKIRSCPLCASLLRIRCLPGAGRGSRACPLRGHWPGAMPTAVPPDSTMVPAQRGATEDARADMADQYCRPTAMRQRLRRAGSGRVSPDLSSSMSQAALRTLQETCGCELHNARLLGGGGVKLQHPSSVRQGENTQPACTGC